jgi:type III secretory pathway component EscR
MDFSKMSLYNDISPQTLIMLGIALAVIFILVMLRICFDIRVLSKGRKEQADRVRGLLLSNMLDRLNIPLKNYFQKTSDMDKERHIWACEHCPAPDECEHMFLGEDIDPETFCPNYDQLKSLKGADAKQANSQ